MSKRTTRILIAFAAGAIGLVGVPGVLAASMAATTGGDVTYTGDAGVNAVTVTFSGPAVYIDDPLGVTAGAGCTRNGPNQVNCPVTKGTDSLAGGPGADTLVAKAGGRDDVRGGAGLDRASADVGDRVARDVERHL